MWTLVAFRQQGADDQELLRNASCACSFVGLGAKVVILFIQSLPRFLARRSLPCGNILHHDYMMKRWSCGVLFLAYA